MKWPVITKLLKRLQHFNGDGDGMEGLWLVSKDLKQMADHLARSRSVMHQAQHANKLAVRHLDHTVNDLKQKTEKSFKIEANKTMKG